MKTVFETENIHGSTLLFDAFSKQVLRGNLSITITDTAATVHLENDVTGITEARAFTTHEQMEVLEWLIGALRDTHTEVDLGLPSPIKHESNNTTVVNRDIKLESNGSCEHCNGLGEVADDKGNWLRCEMCGGSGADVA